MKLNELTADEIARIDKICEQFEHAIRAGTLFSQQASIQEAINACNDEIRRLVQFHGRLDEQHADSSGTPLVDTEALACELNEVRYELVDSRRTDSGRTPFAIPDGDTDTDVDTKPSNVSAKVGALSQADEFDDQATQPPTTDFMRRVSASAEAHGGSNDGDVNSASSGLGGGPRHGELVNGRLSGQQVGPYRIGSVIGKGGMGVVYEASDLRLGRQVAIKFLIARAKDAQEFSERFEREAKAVAALSHPNIVELFDVGSVDLTESSAGTIGDGRYVPPAVTPYAVMEKLAGQTLDDVLKKHRLTADQVRTVGAQIADALAAAHAGGVVHRDLKPQNVMLNWSGESNPRFETDRSSPDLSRFAVKLFDFGLSRIPRQPIVSAGKSGHAPTPIVTDVNCGLAAVNQADVMTTDRSDSVRPDSDKAISGDATLNGVIMGTPGYMAPEQARGQMVCSATDIFSLGAVLHEAFYGRPAFYGATVRERFEANLGLVAQPDESIAGTDPQLAELIARCLNANPMDRPESASALADLLREGLETQSARGISIDRRSFIESIVGGTVGAVSGGWMAATSRSRLQNIEAIGFTTFENRKAGKRSPEGAIGGRMADTGELLASTLSNALSRLDKVTVRRYTPVHGSTPDEFRRLARELEVDALVTGDYEQIQRGTKKFLNVNIAIVWAETGAQLWGANYVIESSGDLLEQSRFAVNVAEAIGRKLTQPRPSVLTENPESFACLEKGLAYADPDSIDGLQMSLKCFRHASQVNPEAAEPYAGLAVASLVLAAQSDDAKSDELISAAQNAIDEAFALDPQTPDARTAEAMLNWQRLENYREAFSFLQSAVMAKPNNWQVNHQFGLLNLAMRNDSEAVRYVRKASKLHSMSVVLKTDLVRAEWFTVGGDRAMVQVDVLADRFAASPLVVGLKVDLLESVGKYAEAAALQDPNGTSKFAAISSDQYFEYRRGQLRRIPYGPFGSTMNEAILTERIAATESSGKELMSKEHRLAKLRDRQPLCLVPLLARHPALETLRGLRQATEMLPRAANPLI